MSTDPVAPPVSPPPATPFAPDWDAIATDVTCPLCGYNLRGLIQPLCPECGYRFEWPSVLNPNLAVHPYLFEHYPQRNIRSFLRTLVRNFQPFRFWKEVQPNQPSRVGRLMIYWAICAAIAIVPGVVMVLWPYFDYLVRGDPPPRFVDYIAEYIRPESGRTIIACWIVCAVFPLFNFAALLVYRQSMRKARVKLSHVLRCAVYSGDAIVWFAIWQLGIFLTHPRPDNAGLLCAIGVVGLFCVNAGRMVSAYRRYMRFNHVVATVVAQQIIVILAIMIVIAYAGWMR